jgi:RNA polymerase sigma-70 factor (ECF subfamily)
VTLERLSDDALSALARAAAKPDSKAIEGLFLELLPRVRNLVRYLVHGDNDVDDLTQEALLMILRGLGSYRSEGEFRSWADRVVARSVFSRKRRHATVELNEDSFQQATLASVDEQIDLAPDSYVMRRQLVTALDQLPPHQRDALVLHYSAGFTIAEVAAELVAEEETVRSRIRLGKAKLRQLLLDVGASQAGQS